MVDFWMDNNIIKNILKKGFTMEEEMLKILFSLSYGDEKTEEEKGISFFEMK